MKVFRLLVAAFVSISLFSCGGASTSSSSENTEAGMPPMVVTAEDSAAVKDLVNDFMSLLKQHETDDAIYSLYDCNAFDESGAPLQLNEEQCQSLVKFYKNWNVVDYSINTIVFDTHEINTVSCKVVLDNNQIFNLTFNPIRAFGKWHLTLKD